MELWDVLDENGNPTGRLVERNNPLNSLRPNEFHLIVQVWILNDQGRFLISKRAPNKTFGGYWETVAGSVIAGETSLQGALRETREEVGITLDPSKRRMLMRDKMFTEWTNYFRDVWFFRENFNIRTLEIGREEVSEVKTATQDEILEMIKNVSFLPFYQYIKDIKISEIA